MLGYCGKDFTDLVAMELASERNRVRVYLAGPYSKHPCHNTRDTILLADELCKLGFIPFVPHLSLLWDTVSPHSYEFWIEYDLHWVRACHAVLRIPGESRGADAEVAEAQRVGIPVFHSVEDLTAHNFNP